VGPDRTVGRRGGIRLYRGFGNALFTFDHGKGQVLVMAERGEVTPPPVYRNVQEH